MMEDDENRCLTINGDIDFSDGSSLPIHAIQSTTNLVHIQHAGESVKIREEIPNEIAKRQIRLTYEDEIIGQSSSSRSSQSLPPGKKYHVFFSHSTEDREWVLQMVSKLESPKYGLKCCFADRDFDLGAPVFANITKYINLSKKTVIVLTPEFLQSPWCSYETRITMEMDLNTKQRLLVPVMLRSCRIPDFIGRLSYIDYDNAHFWESFLQALKSESSGSTYNEAIGSAAIMGGNPFQFNPNFFNTDIITEETVYVGCSCCSESPDEFMPNELLRYGLLLTPDDFNQIVEVVKGVCYVRCRGFYNKILYWIFLLAVELGIAFYAIIVLIVVLTVPIEHRLPGDWSLRTFFCWLSLLISIALLFGAIRLPMIKAAIKALSKAISSANKISIRRNMLISVRDYGCCYCACDRISLIFMYYDWRPCQVG